MKIVFAGTPEFSVAALQALHAAGHAIAGVFTQPDRPAGRGQKLHSSAVSQAAEALGLPVFKPLKFDATAQAQLRELGTDVMVVVAYGLILPQAALDIPKHGCLNIHASLLPRWRGAAPIQRAILAGDTETGITIMQMDAGLDTGAMLLREVVTIGANDTSADLHDRLAALGATLIVKALATPQHATPQPADGATYAKKISKDEARLDWSRPADELARAVRAFNPAPVAWTELNGERVRVFSANTVVSRGGDPGLIAHADDQGLLVNTGKETLRLTRLQRAGGKVLEARDVLRGWNPIGQRFR